MASLVDELIFVLNQQYELLNIEYELLEQKTDILINNEVASLQQMNEKEIKIINKLNYFEEKRQKIINDVQIVMSYEGKDISLKNIIEMFDDEQSEKQVLIKLRQQILDISEKINQKNKENKQLLKISIDMIDFVMNSIQSMNGQYNSTYGANKDINTINNSYFDTKQ